MPSDSLGLSLSINPPSPEPKKGRSRTKKLNHSSNTAKVPPSHTEKTTNSSQSKACTSNSEMNVTERGNATKGFVFEDTSSEDVRIFESFLQIYNKLDRENKGCIILADLVSHR